MRWTQRCHVHPAHFHTQHQSRSELVSMMKTIHEECSEHLGGKIGPDGSFV